MTPRNTPEKFTQVFGMNYEEFIARAHFLYGEQFSEIKNPRERCRIIDNIQARTYSTWAQQMVEETRKLTPREERKREIRDSRYVAAHWLVHSIPGKRFFLEDVEKVPYLHPKTEQQVLDAAAVKQEIDSLEKKLGEDAERLHQRRTPFVNATFYSGEIKKSVVLKSTRWNDMPEPIKEYKGGIKLIDIAQTDDFLKELEREYENRENVPADFFPKVNFLLSNEAHKALRKAGMETAPYDIWILRKMEAGPNPDGVRGNAFIARKFIEEINNLYERVK